MMFIYGLLARDADPDLAACQPVADGGAIEPLVHGELAALVSPLPVPELPPARRHVLAHARVLEQILAAHDVLPVRFGTIAPDRLAVQRWLERYHDTLNNLRRQLSGRIEVGVRLRWRAEQAIAELVRDDTDLRQQRSRLARGADFDRRLQLGELTARLLETKRQQEGDIHFATLAELAERALRLAPTDDETVLHAAFLLPRTAEATFDAALTQLEQQHGERLTIRYVGPMPPFSFADLALPVTEG